MKPAGPRSASCRIGIFAHFDPTWTGGERYLRNLLSALADRDDRDVAVVLYARPEFDTGGLVWPVLEVRKPAFLVRHSPSWYSSKLAERLDSKALDPITRQIQEDGIDVTYLRPAHVSGGRIPNVHWVPDLQHRHLPEMYSDKQWLKCERVEKRAVGRSATIVVSSAVVRDHLLDFEPKAAGKVEILPFAVDLPPEAHAADPEEICRRYDLPEHFFFFPSQLWKHKNHERLMEALARLRDHEDSPMVICTGAATDFRDDSFPKQLLARQAELGLASTIRFLGLLPRPAFYAILRRSLAVLNPSLFEGWSTTVEEAKALGVPQLLSDIAVHREQAGAGSTFFDPRSVPSIADALLGAWQRHKPGPHPNHERDAAIDNHRRRKIFGERFIRIMRETAIGEVKQKPKVA